MDKLEILSECVIKVENVKQEPGDDAEQEACNFMEGNGTFPPFALKRDVKDEDEEEELKPLVRVFLNPEDVPDREVQQEHELDPLAMCSEIVEREWSVGGEYSEGAFSDLKTEREQDDAKSDEFKREKEVAHTKAVVKPSDKVALNKNFKDNSLHISRPHNAIHADEHSVYNESLSESECGERILQEQEEIHKCSVCLKSFKRRKDLMTHIQILNGKCSLECLVCLKSFSSRRKLVRHMQSHSGESRERPHQCFVCQKSFTQRIHLVMHKRIHNGERPHECSVCQMNFTRKNCLNRHMRIHNGERPHECSVCQMNFTRKGCLNRHMRIHNGERPHECSVCQKNFPEKKNLIEHVRIHHEERPYECSICQKSFSDSSNLVIHLRIHSGERPYECSVCQKSFTQKSTLNKHLVIHSGERLHECSICQRSFSQKSNLNKHLLIHSGERRYECSHCQKTFAWSDKLQRHMLIHSQKNLSEGSRQHNTLIRSHDRPPCLYKESLFNRAMVCGDFLLPSDQPDPDPIGNDQLLRRPFSPA